MPPPTTLQHARRTIGTLGAALACLVGGCGGKSSTGSAPIPGARAIGGIGSVPGRFVTPRVLTSDGTLLYVIDKTARVQAIDPVRGVCKWWFTMPQWTLGKPTGARVAPGPRGHPGPALWIADTHYHRVLVYALPEPAQLRDDPGESHPEPIARLGEYGQGPGQFIFPTDVQVLAGPDGAASRIYVSEYGGHDRVSIFDERFTFLGSFGAYGPPGEGAVMFQRPQGSAWVNGPSGQRELWISDSINHRLGRFTPAGELLGWVGQGDHPGAPSDKPGELSHPRGVVTLDNGDVLLAEFGNSRVQRLRADGTGAGTWGRPGRGAGELVQPWSVCVIGREAFALDTGNHRIVSWLLE